MCHSLNLGDVGGPGALGYSSFKVDPALFSIFNKWRSDHSRPVSQAEASCCHANPPPPWEWGRGGGNGKHLSNVTISTEEPGFQEGNNSSVTIFSSK